MKNNKVVLLAILVCFSCLSSCKNEYSYLKNAIKHDAIVCSLIYTEDSALILIDNTSENFIKELSLFSHINDPDTYLLESIRKGMAICVSNQFYKKYSYSQIYADHEMDSIYWKQGVKGLVKKYFKHDMGLFILRNMEEAYPLHGHSPYSAFGKENNIGYMAYILAKHNIYLRYEWIDEGGLLMIIIAEDISDMRQLKLGD